MAIKFSQQAAEAIAGAKSIAYRYRHQEIDVEHLLLSLLDNGEGSVSKVLSKLNVDAMKIINDIEDNLITNPKVSYESSTYSTDQFNQALLNSEKLTNDIVNEGHLFISAFKELPWLDRYAFDEKKFLAYFPKQSEVKIDVDDSDFLEKYGKNLIEEAKKGDLDPVIGRDEEIRRTIRILSRRTKNNPILIGEPGVGKTAVVEGLAQRILNKDVPESLQDKIIFSLDIASLLAGTKYRGEFEERLKNVVKAIEANEKIIVFIDEVHNLIGTGKSEGAMDASNILKPLLARGQLRVIGATTTEEYRKYIEKDLAFERRFQPIRILEPSVEDAISILRGLKEKFEVYHGVRIADNAIVSAVQLSARYITDRYLPDKAIDIIDEAAATVRTEIDSIPGHLDEIVRKVMQLEIEREALRKEDDRISQKRLEKLEQELSTMIKDRDSIKIRWDIEKSSISKVKKIKNDIEQMNIEVSEAERSYDLNKIAELKYGKLLALEKSLKEQEQESGFRADKLVKEEVTEQEVSLVLSRWTGIPLSKILNEEKKRILSLQETMESEVIGQDHVVKAVSQAVLRARSGLKDPNRPIGSFLFLGPTGVGKTHLAKTLAKYLFGDRNNIIRMDMSEYMDKSSVSRLIGAAPGYVGYDEGGQLTEQVKKSPYSVILFDEIEKAHPDIFNILLQVMDDGRLTDSRGKLIDFKNTIIILTSNVGSKLSQDDRVNIENKKGKIFDEIRSFFKPEFLNRLDEIALFNSLSQDKVRQITLFLLNDINKKLENKNIRLTFDAKVVDYISKKGYDSEYGARPIRRLIQREIETDIASKLINNEILDNSNVRINVKNGQLVYEVINI